MIRSLRLGSPWLGSLRLGSLRLAAQRPAGRLGHGRSTVRIPRFGRRSLFGAVDEKAGVAARATTDWSEGRLGTGSPAASRSRTSADGPGVGSVGASESGPAASLPPPVPGDRARSGGDDGASHQPPPPGRGGGVAARAADAGVPSPALLDDLLVRLRIGIEYERSRGCTNARGRQPFAIFVNEGFRQILLQMGLHERDGGGPAEPGPPRAGCVTHRAPPRPGVSPGPPAPASPLVPSLALAPAPGPTLPLVGLRLADELRRYEDAGVEARRRSLEGLVGFLDQLGKVGARGRSLSEVELESTIEVSKARPLEALTASRGAAGVAGLPSPSQPTAPPAPPPLRVLPPRPALPRGSQLLTAAMAGGRSARAVTAPPSPAAAPAATATSSWAPGTPAPAGAGGGAGAALADRALLPVPILVDLETSGFGSSAHVLEIAAQAFDAPGSSALELHVRLPRDGFMSSGAERVTGMGSAEVRSPSRLEGREAYARFLDFVRHELQGPRAGPGDVSGAGAEGGGDADGGGGPRGRGEEGPEPSPAVLRVPMLVAHNASFDLSMLDSMADRYGLPRLRPVLKMDTLALARATVGRETGAGGSGGTGDGGGGEGTTSQSLSLPSLHAYLLGHEPEVSHRAADDVRALDAVLRGLLARAGVEPGRPLHRLGIPGFRVAPWSRPGDPEETAIPDGAASQLSWTDGGAAWGGWAPASRDAPGRGGVGVGGGAAPGACGVGGKAAASAEEPAAEANPGPLHHPCRAVGEWAFGCEVAETRALELASVRGPFAPPDAPEADESDPWATPRFSAGIDPKLPLPAPHGGPDAPSLVPRPPLPRMPGIESDDPWAAVAAAAEASTSPLLAPLASLPRTLRPTPKLGELLSALGVWTLADLARFFPTSYTEFEPGYLPRPEADATALAGGEGGASATAVAVLHASDSGDGDSAAAPPTLARPLVLERPRRSSAARLHPLLVRAELAEARHVPFRATQASLLSTTWWLDDAGRPSVPGDGTADAPPPPQARLAISFRGPFHLAAAAKEGRRLKDAAPDLGAPSTTWLRGLAEPKQPGAWGSRGVTAARARPLGDPSPPGGPAIWEFLSADADVLWNVRDPKDHAVRVRYSSRGTAKRERVGQAAAAAVRALASAAANRGAVDPVDAALGLLGHGVWAGLGGVGGDVAGGEAGGEEAEGREAGGEEAEDEEAADGDPAGVDLVRAASTQPALSRLPGHLPPFAEAVRMVHAPTSALEAVLGRSTLAFRELFLLQLRLALTREQAFRDARRDRGGEGPEGSRAAEPRERDPSSLDATQGAPGEVGSGPSAIAAGGPGPASQTPPDLSFLPAAAERELGFELTPGQASALASLRRRFASGAPPSSVLLQGDVGSGKTAVVFLAMLDAVARGGQAALVAPTTVLADQHATKLRSLLRAAWEASAPPPSPGSAPPPLLPLLEVVLLSSARTAAELREARRLLATGRRALVVGTHAVLVRSTSFSDLRLAVVDEQHRFGVAQRARLRAMARPEPHILDVSATPVPRSLAALQHGGSSRVALPGGPPGRGGVTTKVAAADDLGADAEALDAIRREVERGGRVFVVCPLVGDEAIGMGRASRAARAAGGRGRARRAGAEASALSPGSAPSSEGESEGDPAWLDGDETTDASAPPSPSDEETSSDEAIGGSAAPLVSVSDERSRLVQAGVVAPHEVALLHGRLHPEEKLEVLRAFREGSTKVLVATSVIEVGVDVPDATLMIVRGADRFGLAALHQLRGRVGRGALAGTAWLFAGSERGLERLELLQHRADGAAIAEADLEARGAGDALGLRQAGGRSALVAASLPRDLGALEAATEAAARFLAFPGHRDPSNWPPDLAALVLALGPAHLDTPLGVGEGSSSEE